MKKTKRATVTKDEKTKLREARLKQRQRDQAELEEQMDRWDAFGIRYPSSKPVKEFAAFIIRNLYCQDCATPEVELLLGHQIQHTIDAFLASGVSFNDDGSLRIDEHGWPVESFSACPMHDVAEDEDDETDEVRLAPGHYAAGPKRTADEAHWFTPGHEFEYPCVLCGAEDAAEHKPHCPSWYLGRTFTSFGRVKGRIEAYDSEARLFEISWLDKPGRGARWTLEALTQDAVLDKAALVQQLH